MSLLEQKRAELLRHLAKHGESTVAELAEALDCDPWYVRLVVARTPTEVRFKNEGDLGLASSMFGLMSDAVVEFGQAEGFARKAKRKKSK